MVEADIDFRPHHTSVLGINIFEPLVCYLKGIWVHPYTVVTQAKLVPDLGILGCLWSVKMVPLHHSWGWYPPQTATHILCRHKKVFEALGCCLKGRWVHPYTGTPARLAPDLQSQGSLWSQTMPQRHGWGWYPPQTTYYIHIRDIQSDWVIGMLSQGRVGAPLYRYTGQVGPYLGGFRFTWWVKMMP